jgi:hypothetical protein
MITVSCINKSHFFFVFQTRFKNHWHGRNRIWTEYGQKINIIFMLIYCSISSQNVLEVFSCLFSRFLSIFLLTCWFGGCILGGLNAYRPLNYD